MALHATKFSILIVFLVAFSQGESSKDGELHFKISSGDIEGVERILDLNPHLIEWETPVFSVERTPLHAASKYGRTDIVELLLKFKANIESQDLLGKTPLHIASEHGKTQVVELLLKLKANIESRDEYKWTPLHCASSRGHVEVVKLLLGANANTKAKSKSGKTPLDVASTEQIKEILNSPQKFLGDELYAACQNGGTAKVREILKSHPNLINWKNPSQMERTPLHIASVHGKTQVVELLLKLKANIEAQDSYEWTPLHYASLRGHVEVVKLLLEANANTKAKSKSGKTPLDVASTEDIKEILNSPQKFLGDELYAACQNGGTAKVREILKSHPNLIDWKNPSQMERTPLHVASVHGKTQVVELLLKLKANIESPDKYEWTPLHCASSRGHVEVVKLLLEAKANTKAKSESGKTPFDIAATEEIKQLLSRASPDTLEFCIGFFFLGVTTFVCLYVPYCNFFYLSSPSPLPSPSPIPVPSPNSSRTDDVAREDLNNSLPIRGVWDRPLLSFKRAVQIANVPHLDIRDVDSCLEHFEDVEHPPPGLTVDEACAVRFYTMETPFYRAFNSALRTRDRDEAKRFFPFLQLLLLAMHKLPKSEGTLFRGTRNLPVPVIDEYKRKAETRRCIFWGACSSTTTSVRTLSNPMFCGQVGNRVKFVIQDCGVGASVEALSAIGVENEVLLPPCLRFKVEGYVDLGNGLLEFQLRYSAPEHEVIPLIPPPEFLSSSAP